ncbi:MAG: death-on-curing protein [Candidatus Schekmanbacteria bacterium RBG_13_48_7]|uniref:Death-on-curing protein n=1 Tax=Candidatus Schekmanbacteria bacterium RBG_13_48_7 TaxID=1817878 RepID=A0A1F7RMY7_9BACT|nr:MAG: death-on-curing protein [Candidatus Schekmanbacteria bacterium RBG_13_48_7]
MEPIFLTLGEVLEIHRDQIKRYGGDPDIRDLRLLQSAVAIPASSFGGQYFHGDLFEMGAAYLFHIVQNHPFIDGNKRTGAVSALVFLELNGIEVDTDEKAFENMVRSVAEGKSVKSAVAEFLRMK